MPKKQEQTGGPPNAQSGEHQKRGSTAPGSVASEAAAAGIQTQTGRPRKAPKTLIKDQIKTFLSSNTTQLNGLKYLPTLQAKVKSSTTTPDLVNDLVYLLTDQALTDGNVKAELKNMISQGLQEITDPNDQLPILTRREFSTTRPSDHFSTDEISTMKQNFLKKVLTPLDSTPPPTDECKAFAIETCCEMKPPTLSEAITIANTLTNEYDRTVMNCLTPLSSKIVEQPETEIRGLTKSLRPGNTTLTSLLCQELASSHDNPEKLSLATELLPYCSNTDNNTIPGKITIASTLIRSLVNTNLGETEANVLIIGTIGNVLSGDDKQHVTQIATCLVATDMDSRRVTNIINGLTREPTNTPSHFNFLLKKAISNKKQGKSLKQQKLL